MCEFMGMSRGVSGVNLWGSSMSDENHGKAGEMMSGMGGWDIWDNIWQN